MVGHLIAVLVGLVVGAMILVIILPPLMEVWTS